MLGVPDLSATLATVRSRPRAGDPPHPHEEPVRLIHRAAIAAIALLAGLAPAAAGAAEPVLHDGFEAGLGAWTIVANGSAVVDATEGAAHVGTLGLRIRTAPGDGGWLTRAFPAPMRRTVVRLDVRLDRAGRVPLVSLRGADEPRILLVTDGRGRLRLVGPDGEASRVVGVLRRGRWASLALTADRRDRRVSVAVGRREAETVRMTTGALDAIRLGGGDRDASIAFDALDVTGIPVATPEPTPEPTPSVFRFTGRGSDHGVGLSQWGAYGRAAAGQSYEEILAHYYPGTTLETRPGGRRTIRVLLLDNEPVLADDPLLICGRKGGWTIEGTELLFPSGSCARFAPNEVKGEPPVVRVTDTDGVERYVGDGSDVRVIPVGPAAILALPVRKRGERLRGNLRVIIRAGGRADVIDELPMETYLRAVVPREMSPSRPADALKAQAVAARSYAIDHLRPLDKAWDVYDDGSSQAYGGIDAERPETDAAVLATANQVLTYDGNVINAVYHSQGGGATEDSRYVWNPADGSPGVDTPYLHGSPDVDDDGKPYDAGGPYDSWKTRTFTLEQLSRIMGADPMTDVGRIAELRMKDRGVSERLISVTLVGESGRKRTVAGWYFKSVFNRERRIGGPLLSTLFFLTPAP